MKLHEFVNENRAELVREYVEMTKGDFDRFCRDRFNELAKDKVLFGGAEE